jgi:hypothetical protein
MVIYRARLYFVASSVMTFRGNMYPIIVLQNQMFVVDEFLSGEQKLLSEVKDGGARFLPRPERALLDEKKLEENPNYWVDQFYEKLFFHERNIN